MDPSAAAHLHSLAVDLNGPATYLHWSFIEISLANLIVIAVMIVIFGVALLIRFPHRGADLPPAEPGDDHAVAAAAPEEGDARMWTARVRVATTRLLSPRKLLPDRQPAYVSSWIYIFGVASLVALGIVIASGFALALGGSDWWHTNPVGHFFNSVHLWSVELFMAFLVIHLWGKFWMAAWRGRRAMTWITGVLSFLASVVTAFTGYLSQQNFDSQWIATNGKDAFNAIGIGSIWNALNFGQMFMWHIVLMPAVLVAIIGAHVLLVRMRGVSHPLPRQRPRGRDARKAAAAADAGPWRGPTRRYDILKEGTIAAVIVGALTLVMAGVLSSPDVPSLTIKTWARVDPVGFVNTASAELDGTAGAASYGPPYNNGTGAVQQVGPVNWQKLAGITQPVSASRDFVIGPLGSLAQTTPGLGAALQAYTSAPTAQQTKWAAAYDAATAPGAKKVPFNNGNVNVPAAGPVPALIGGRAGHGPQRRPRLRPAGPAAVLRHRLHQAAAVHRRRRVLQHAGVEHAPHRRPVGRHERDRQLPRPAVAMAVPDVVPRLAVPELVQRGHLGGLPDGQSARSCCCWSRSSPACVTSRGWSRCTGSSGGPGTGARRPARPRPTARVTPPRLPAPPSRPPRHRSHRLCLPGGHPPDPQHEIHETGGQG